MRELFRGMADKQAGEEETGESHREITGFKDTRTGKGLSDTNALKEDGWQSGKRHPPVYSSIFSRQPRIRRAGAQDMGTPSSATTQHSKWTQHWDANLTLQTEAGRVL